MDYVRAALNRSLFNTIQWMTFPVWARLLVQNRFRVHPLYWPRAAMLTLTSLIATVMAAIDLLFFGWFVRRARVRAPLIILGHFRSGTTHLHNLLALDRSFGFPTLYQTLNPDGFLCSEALLRLPIRLLLTSHRPQDQVAIDPTVPAEDEVAVAVGTLASPYIGWVFPGRRDRFYDRYLTLDDVPDADLRRWKRGLLRFLRKVSWKSGRPLILKSPTHTARVALLLELFPDARFIHIHRNPAEVFTSTRRLLTKLPPYFNVQPLPRGGLDDHIVEQYRRMYDAYLDQRHLIPEGQLCEVAFDDLERDPLGTLTHIYRALGLAGFDRVEPELRRYLDSLAGYRKNSYDPLPPHLSDRLAREWRRVYDAFGYPLPPTTPSPHLGRLGRHVTPADRP